jgi:hypothetical protein
MKTLATLILLSILSTPAMALYTYTNCDASSMQGLQVESHEDRSSSNLSLYIDKVVDQSFVHKFNEDNYKISFGEDRNERDTYSVFTENGYITDERIYDTTATITIINLDEKVKKLLNQYGVKVDSSNSFSLDMTCEYMHLGH